jgi:hypothetical protein
LEHPGLAVLLAAHARPPNYTFFYHFYESRNLAEKLHVEEWAPSPEFAVSIALDLGDSLFFFLFIFFLLTLLLETRLTYQ